jgi:hypothetical protein
VPVDAVVRASDPQDAVKTALQLIERRDA